MHRGPLCKYTSTIIVGVVSYILEESPNVQICPNDMKSEEAIEGCIRKITTRFDLQYFSEYSRYNELVRRVLGECFCFLRLYICIYSKQAASYCSNSNCTVHSVSGVRGARRFLSHAVRAMCHLMQFVQSSLRIFNRPNRRPLFLHHALRSHNMSNPSCVGNTRAP